MEGLPCLPGYGFVDPTKTCFHRSNTLTYKNGYQVPQPYPYVGIGGDPLKVNQLTEEELDELANFHPTLTYGRTRQAAPAPFIPGHVALDKKVLRFYGYFKETVTESHQEHYRVRSVIIYYYLEDDTMHLFEPKQQNSGLAQGWVLKRQRVPKNDVGEHYVWKDLNIGINLTIYGRVYRVTNCDEFTRNFFESEGIEMNEPEPTPDDPYLKDRARIEEIRENMTKSTFDSRRQHCELDRRVLRFYAVWDDRKELFGDLRRCVILYFLMDDTMEVREQHARNDGRDPCSVLIRRHRVPKDRDSVPPTFPSACLELTPHEIKEYYTPMDLKIGESLVIYGRAFLLHDCDSFTKAWYYQNFGLTDFKPIDVEIKKPERQKMELPFYNGFGSLEDSLASCKTFLPEPPKVDFEKQVDYSTKVLRYGAKLDSVHPNDALRKFIISYRLADDMLQIWETPVRNTGFLGGTFLKRTRVAKPGSTTEAPQFYGPRDFSLGSIIDIFGTRFVITDADEYVVKFMEANRDQFPDSLIDSLSAKVVEKIFEKKQVDDRSCRKGGAANIKRTPGDLDKMVDELAVQFRNLALSDEVRIDALFLKYNKDRLCYVDIANLKDICRKFQLPGDEDVLNRFLDRYGHSGRLTLEEFRAFFQDKPKPHCGAHVCMKSTPCI